MRSWGRGRMCERGFASIQGQGLGSCLQARAPSGLGLHLGRGTGAEGQQTQRALCPHLQLLLCGRAQRLLRKHRWDVAPLRARDVADTPAPLCLSETEEGKGTSYPQGHCPRLVWVEDLYSCRTTRARPCQPLPPPPPQLAEPKAPAVPALLGLPAWTRPLFQALPGWLVRAEPLWR